MAIFCVKLVQKQKLIDISMATNTP